MEQTLFIIAATIVFTIIVNLIYDRIAGSTEYGHRPRHVPRPQPGPRPMPRPQPGPGPRPAPSPRPRPTPRPQPGPRPRPQPRPIPSESVVNPSETNSNISFPENSRSSRENGQRSGRSSGNHQNSSGSNTNVVSAHSSSSRALPSQARNRERTIYDFPCCPIHRCRNRKNEHQVIFWDPDTNDYRCGYGHHFSV